jgi:hypothetical protein
MAVNGRFNRRTLLRGLGGAVVAAPFLSSVVGRKTKAQSAPSMSSEAPKRLIVYFTHYGCLTDRWFPALSHGPLSMADYAAMQTLYPMAPYADKLLMVRGIRAMNEWSFQGTLGQTTDPHTQVCGSYFTCQPVAPSDGKFTAMPTGRSLDHVAAEQVNPSGSPPLFMQICGVYGSSSNTQCVISYDQVNQIFPGYGSPLQIYTNLTNLFGAGAPSQDSYQVAAGKSIIDIVRDDLNTLQSVNMSGADQKKLADWVELLHQTSTTITSMCSADTAASLGVTSDTVQTAQGMNGLNLDITQVAPIMMDLAVLTALCDANRVIFMKMPPNYVFKNLGLTVESESLSHRNGNANMGGTCLTGVMDMIHAIDVYYAQQFAYLVGKLDSFEEGDGTLLDNTATVWFQEMSDGSACNLNNLPILQAGGCGGYFKTGWAINVEGGKTDLTAGNSDGDCQNGMTLKNVDDAGTPPNQASMPINKYYCNLMNAIGMQADATGFPVKGGTEPVSCYGKYDDTTLFGTSTPAIIKNPGEYSELRAT